jgi:putative ABC transport system substrate-binding protein
MRVDVILIGGDSEALAAKRATATIPIVAVAVGDPVGSGLVESLARPGGNVTGTALALSETAGKRLELLREVVPGLKRVAIFGNSGNPLVAPERNAAIAGAGGLGGGYIGTGYGYGFGRGGIGIIGIILIVVVILLLTGRL